MASETVLITGASAGIGLELARCFAADGSKLILVARRRDKLEALAENLRGEHDAKVRVMTHDLSQPQAPDQLFEQLRDETVDVLVNNAGFGARGEFAQLDLQRQMDMVQVHVVALTRLARLFLPGMLERNRGGIINVASTAAFQPGPYMAVYYATKAFVLSFSEAIAEEVRRSKVKISCLCPGPTVTEFGEVADMSDTKLFSTYSMTAEAVARASYEGFRKGKVLVIPGKLNRVGTLSVRVMPMALSRKIAGWLQK